MIRATHFGKDEDETANLLRAAEKSRDELPAQQAHLQRLAVIVQHLARDPAYAERAADLFATVSPVTRLGEQAHGRVEMLRSEIKRREKHRLHKNLPRSHSFHGDGDFDDYQIKVLAFAGTVAYATELTSFPVPTLDSAEEIGALPPRRSPRMIYPRESRPPAAPQLTRTCPIAHS